MIDKSQWLAIGLLSGFAYILGKDRESFEAEEFYKCKNCDYNVELEVEAVFEGGLCSNCLVKEGFQKEYGTHGKWMKNGEYAKKIKGATYEDYDAESFEAKERWYLSDPCYAIPEDRWGEFVGKLPNNLKNKKVDVKWEVDGKEYIVEVWQSPGGDGVWSFPIGDFGVDAGLLAVIPEKVAMEGKRPFGGKWFNKKPTLFTDEKKYVVKINNKRNKNVDNRFNPFDAESFERGSYTRKMGKGRRMLSNAEILKFLPNQQYKCAICLEGYYEPLKEMQLMDLIQMPEYELLNNPDYNININLINPRNVGGSLRLPTGELNEDNIEICCDECALTEQFTATIPKVTLDQLRRGAKKRRITPARHIYNILKLSGIPFEAESFEAEKINTFSEIENKWKDSSVTIYDEDADEFYGVKEILVQEGDDVLEDGHPYLVLNKDSGDLDSQVFYRDFQTGYDAESFE